MPGLLEQHNQLTIGLSGVCLVRCPVTREGGTRGLALRPYRLLRSLIATLQGHTAVEAGAQYSHFLWWDCCETPNAMLTQQACGV